MDIDSNYKISFTPKHNHTTNLTMFLEPLNQRHFYVYDAKSSHFIEKDEILYCQASGSYTKIVLLNQNEIVASKRLKLISIQLNDYDNFIRVHHSFVINKNHIANISSSQNNLVITMVDGHKFPVSRRKKSLVKDNLLGMISA